MQQHDKDEYVDFSKMSEPEIIMHHFRQFDHDKDGMVDGLEVLKQIRIQNGRLKSEFQGHLILFILVEYQFYDGISNYDLYIFSRTQR